MAGVLHRHWVNLRNRLLADPGFRRLGASFPLFRPAARDSARRLFDLMAGFVYAQTLAAAVECGLFGHLAGGAREAGALAREAGLPEGAMHRLLRAGAALALFEDMGDDRYALGPLGAAFSGTPGLDRMVRHHGVLYRDLADPVGLLKAGPGAGSLRDWWPYGQPDAHEQTLDYSGLMAATQPMIAEQVIDSLDLSRARRLLDIGGGTGAFALACARRHDHLTVEVFDLPTVAEAANARIAAEAMTTRARAIAGDFRRDPLPTGADVITFVRILHDHGEDTVRAVLAAARAAIAPGGMVVVAEPMSDAPRRDPMAEAYFGFYLRAMGHGRARTPREIMRLLDEADFRSPRPRATAIPMICRVVTARA
jgi:demethylspheroidene O-methyltransferase